MIISLAWKNLWRNPKRSSIILTSIMLGVGLGLFSSGVMVGSVDSMVESAISRSLGHIQIHHPEYMANRSYNLLISNSDSVVQLLKSIPGVTGHTSRTKLEGMVSSARTSRGVIITGVDRDLEMQMTSIHDRLVDGTYLEPMRLPQALISQRLAEKLNVQIKSKIRLDFQDADGHIMSGAFRVTGLFATQSSIFDEMTVFVPKKDLENLLDGSVPVHEISIRLADHDRLDSTRIKAQALLGSLQVQTWKELAPDLKLTAEMMDVMMAFFMGIILFGLLFGITNTMLMSVMDRTREFGMLMAVGMNRLRVFTLILIETICLSLAGGLVGMAFGLVAIGYYGGEGLDISAFAEGMAQYGYPTMLYPAMTINYLVMIVIMIMITAILAAVYPALKAIRLNPSTAIRTI